MFCWTLALLWRFERVKAIWSCVRHRNTKLVEMIVQAKIYTQRRGSTMMKLVFRFSLEMPTCWELASPWCEVILLLVAANLQRWLWITTHLDPHFSWGDQSGCSRCSVRKSYRLFETISANERQENHWNVFMYICATHNFSSTESPSLRSQFPLEKGP